MKAILNYYDDPELSKCIIVRVGDKVVSNVEEFGLRIGSSYEVKYINSIDMITIKLEDGSLEMFTVEYFSSVIKS